MHTLKKQSILYLFNKFIKATQQGRRRQADGKRITKGTIENYIYLQQHLELFISTSGSEWYIMNLNKAGKRSILAEHKRWQKFHQKFTDYLYRQNLYDNYVGMLCKLLRTFFNYLQNELHIVTGGVQRLFTVPKEEAPIVVLTPEQLQSLIHINDKSLKDKSMEMVKDIFVFGCTVALRVSDLLRLQKIHLEYRSEDHVYLVIQSKKTATYTRVKLPAYAITIIEKYKNNKRKTIFPSISNACLNEKIKQLFAYLGYVQPFYKTRMRRGEPVQQFKDATHKTAFRFCDMITSHTMRRTAITTMLCLGMPEYAVRLISGHAPNSKEFFRYVALSQQFMDNATEQVFGKLARNGSCLE